MKLTISWGGFQFIKRCIVRNFWCFGVVEGRGHVFWAHALRRAAPLGSRATAVSTRPAAVSTRPVAVSTHPAAQPPPTRDFVCTLRDLKSRPLFQKQENDGGICIAFVNSRIYWHDSIKFKGRIFYLLCFDSVPGLAERGKWKLTYCRQTRYRFLLDQLEDWGNLAWRVCFELLSSGEFEKMDKSLDYLDTSMQGGHNWKTQFCKVITEKHSARS